MNEYKKYLFNEEKSPATVDKYLRDVRSFREFAQNKNIDKELVIAYKQHLLDEGYAIASINSMLASVNNYVKYIGKPVACVKLLRMQKKIYTSEDKELTKEEYKRLLDAAKKKPRIKLIMQTICSTGIRVSELAYFTVEAIKKGEINISCKNKIRTILIPGKLRRLLLKYAKQNQIIAGAVFCTKSGKPLNRSNIWSEMKKLCDVARVNAKKIFPHNLRKLFARTFYKMEKDIAKLADILGHSNINTTRIYIVSTGMEHRRKIENLKLLME